jgi:DNA-binding IclR family transcriptional regulator
VREGTEVLFIDRFAHCSTPLPARMGSRGPLHATALGKVLLAAAPDDVVERVLSGPLRAYTPYTVTDPHRLREQLATVRERGVAYADQERRLGIVGVAVPIRGPVGQVIAGIDIPGPRAVVLASQRKRELLLRQAAAEIERAIRARSSRRRTAPAGQSAAVARQSG